MRHITKTNPHLMELIKNLEKLANKEKVRLWKVIAEELKKPVRQQREVNIFHIARVTKDNETIIVPGKVLGDGDIKHKVNVVAFNFTQSAKKKVHPITIQELMKTNPKAKGVRIIG